ncbi:MAG: MFS transporter [Candidatus Thermoplasmatota archaeon]|nr:MFS transporter [Candidatus Thermoplasmatota archaeon]
MRICALNDEELHNLYSDTIYSPISDRKLFRAENLVILTTLTLVFTGYSAAYLFTSLFLLQAKDSSLLFVGAIYLITGAVDIALQTIGGRLSDILGTKTVTSAGLTGSIILYLTLMLSVEFNVQSGYYLVEFPLLSLFIGLFLMAISSHVSDRDVSEMAEGMSLLYVGGNFGYTLGPIIGGIIVTYSGYKSLFVLGFILSLASMVVILQGIKANPKFAARMSGTESVQGKKDTLKPGVMMLIVLIFISWFAIAYQAIPLSTFESKFLNISSLDIGILLGTNGALITVFQSAVSRRIGIERNRKLYSVAFGSLMMAIGYLVVSYAKSFSVLEIAITLTTFGEIMIAVPTQVVLTMFSGRHNRGRYQGYYFAASRSGSSISVFFALVVFSFLGAEFVRGWYIVAAICIIAGISYAILSRTIEREYRAATEILIHKE